MRTIFTSTVEEPLCLLGDFNSIWNKVDRAGCIYSNRDSSLLNAFLEDHNLLEINGTNYFSTWLGPGKKGAS